MPDRRVFGRLKVKFPLRFLNRISGDEEHAQVVDISAGGLGFVTEKSIAINTPLELWLNIPDRHLPFYTKGDVAWTWPSLDGGQHHVGVRFEKPELMGLARILWLNKD